MSLFELFLIALGLSMDAFAVSVCKGLSMPYMRWKHAGIIGLWFGGFQALTGLHLSFLESLVFIWQKNPSAKRKKS